MKVLTVSDRLGTMRPTPNAQRHLSVSVIVLTYNTTWKRIRGTLKSIILQKNIDFEIIISDDCSKEQYTDEIKNFFARYSFTNYKLISHEKNIGTVLNFLGAVKQSHGKYIRGLGQGDMFFDEYTLRDSYNFMEENKADIIVGKAVFYWVNSNPIKLIAHERFPQDIDAYRDPDILRESYLMDEQNVSGATIMYKREIALNYMTEAAEVGMKYIEDFMTKCIVFDKRRIFFLNRNTIYYEFGAGISTFVAEDDVLAKESIEQSKRNDAQQVDKLLLARCKASPSEFSDRLAEKLSIAIANRSAQETKRLSRKKLKERFGIFILPAVWVHKLFWMIKEHRHYQDVARRNANCIKTDINVSTDFANLCLNCE